MEENPFTLALPNHSIPLKRALHDSSSDPRPSGPTSINCQKMALFNGRSIFGRNAEIWRKGEKDQKMEMREKSAIRMLLWWCALSEEVVYWLKSTQKLALLRGKESGEEWREEEEEGGGGRRK